MKCHLEGHKCSGKTRWYQRHMFALCWYHARRLGCPEVLTQSELRGLYPHWFRKVLEVIP